MIHTRRTCLLPVLMLLALAGCPGKPQMTLSEMTHHFVQTENTWTFKVLNTGDKGSELSFSIAAPTGKRWVTVSPESGTIKGGESADITASVNWAYSVKAVESFRTVVLQVSGVDQDENDLGIQEITLTTACNYFTAEYAAADVNALEGNHYTFTPDGSMNYYAVSAERKAYQFATKPDGGQVLNLSADAPTQVALSTPVQFYGNTYSTLWVSRTGTISFQSPVNPTPQTLAAHFTDVRVCPLSSMDAGSEYATASYKELSDRVAFTFEDAATLGEVADVNAATTVQVELYGDGRVKLAYILVNPPAVGNSIVGLCNAPPTRDGIPADFVASKLPPAP